MTVTAVTSAQAIADARSEIQWLSELHHGLKDGTRFWWEWDDAYTITERTAAAIGETHEALCQARERLAALTGGGV